MAPPVEEAAAQPRVMVADDEPHIRRILTTLLEAAGFHVDAVSDGLQAMEHLRDPERPYDLVLLDLMMPLHTGLDVLQEVGGMPHRDGLPVVILTAKGQDADREEAFSMGAADFVTKPFSPKKLLGRIRDLLAR